MKILLSGYHNPNFVNSVVYREKAIGYLGHELVSFDDRSYCLPGRLRQTFAFLERWDLGRINERFVDAVKRSRPQLCFVVGGQRILPEAVKAVRQLGVRVVLWTTDSPDDFENILSAAPEYDKLFCAGSEAVDIFRSHGLSAVHVPFACDPAYHRPVKLSQDDRARYGRDIVFVGSYYPNRGKMLEQIADLDLGVWGPYWKKLPATSPLAAKAVDAKINFDEWVKIFSACRINVVVHYNNPQVPCHQASPKLFEAMACGSFVLCDRQKDAQALFKDGQHLVFFDDARDLREKIRYYLEHEETRRRIAACGREEALGKHTYALRFEEMIRQIGL